MTTKVTGSANEPHQATREERKTGGQKVNVCQNETAGFVRMKTGRYDKPLKCLERVKGIEPSYSAWKASKKAKNGNEINGVWISCASGVPVSRPKSAMTSRTSWPAWRMSWSRGT